MGKNEKTCENCKFWDQLACCFYGTEKYVGSCRRFPPYKQFAMGEGVWPKTIMDDWCGEFTENKEDDA